MPKLTQEERKKIEQERTKNLIKKVKIAQKQLNMDDESYRSMLFDVTNKRSSTQCRAWELENVIQRMKTLGFVEKTPASAGTRPLAADGQSKLIRKLWLELHQAGKVQDSSERALCNWAKGQLKSSDGIEALQWLDTAQKQRLIEGLKQWQNRPAK